MSLLGVKLKLGMFPGTGKIEKQHHALVKEYHEYTEYSRSEELARFEYLNRYLNSSEFEEKENNPDADHDEIDALKTEFEQLKKSRRLLTWFKTRIHEAKFLPLKTWKLEFEDHFTGDKLDKSKWLTRYYWADKLLDDTYTLPGDRHYITNGKNISLSGSKLFIHTQREPARGRIWNPAVGFVPGEFSYTSGVINTGKSFRHQFGKVEAKVKVPKGNVYHAFWLAGERMLPQVNIFKYTGGKFYLGNYWGNAADPANGINEDHTAISGAFAGKSYIFSLEWTSRHLIWSINGVVFKTMQRGIPSEPLYIAFGSGIEGDAAVSDHVKLEIDWVRFYSKVSVV